MEKLFFMLKVLLGTGFASFLIVMLICWIKRHKCIKETVEHDKTMFWNTQLQDEIDEYENRR